ncbi:MAG: 4-(cytidine 5'-diphospho)-2-C-methyl-D-erythritol kinase [Candidatus Polarisedimenticolia bacterium]
MKTLHARSCAKINLELRILGRREDGFHDVKTILQAIDLCDEMDFEEAPEITLDVTGTHQVPTGEANLVMRAARSLAARASGLGARIRLRKQIPVGSGLGGGSSNAAVTLMALDRLWGLNTDPGALNALARSLGSDVPFFLYGGTCLGLGRGDEVIPMPDAPPRSVAVLWPREGLSTKQIYEGLPMPLTKMRILSSIKGFHPGTPTRDAEAPDRAPDSESFPDPVNDLEQIAFGVMPRLARLKERLLASGAMGVAMSGSGSAIYGLYPAARELDALTSLLQSDDAEVLACRTLTREAYRKRLFERSRT